MKSTMSYFSEANDPREHRTKSHLLEAILFITMAAVACGAETWNHIEACGHAKGKRLDTGWNNGYLLRLLCN